MLALSLALTAAGTYSVYRSVEARDRLRFQNAVQRTQALIEGRMDTYISLLRATSGLFAIDESVGRQEFHSFVQRLEVPRRYPGIQGIGFTRRAAPGEKEALVTAMRREFADFRVWPEFERPEYHAILYLEPLDRRNRAAIGFDMFTEPVRRAAMERARDTGLPAASGKVTLVQEIDPGRKQAGFLIYLPIYRHGARLATVADRRAALLGFVYSPFRADDLMQGILRAETVPNIAFEIFAGNRAAPEGLLHRSSPAVPDGTRARFRTARHLDLAGYPWTISYVTAPGFESLSARPQVLVLPLAGVLVSAVLFLLTRSLVRSEMEKARLYEAERRARAEAETANHAKDRFMAALSHELRTPLTPVLMVVSRLAARARAGDLPPELHEGFAMIRRNVELETRLIDDLLDLTRIREGKLELRRGPADLREILDHALETSFAHVPEGERPRRKVDFAPADHRLLADAPRLTQVFWNLLNNALKFTPAEGEIRVRTRREAPDALVVEIADTGAGIEPDLLPRIFDAFAQGPRSPSRHSGGLGLGLSIGRTIVEAHGGALTVASDGCGKGSTFTVRLPACLPQAAQAPAAAEPAVPACGIEGPESLHILLVEDYPDAAEALADFLRAAGRTVTVAGSVRDALAKAAATQGNGRESFDLVVSDIGLPDGTGYELMAELSRRYGLHGIALTGYGMEEDIARSRQAGFRKHLTKPVNAEALEAAIRQVIESRE